MVKMAEPRHLTVTDVCEELGISKSTFYDWRAARKAPACIKLPNGGTGSDVSCSIGGLRVVKSTPDGREPDASYDVRIWKIDRYQGVRATTFTVRWRVAGRRHRRTFATAKLADAFRAELLIAARRGAPFHLDSGVPSSLQLAEPERTWVEHAEDYVRVKWPTASPRHRRGIAEALTDVTSVLLPGGTGRPPEPALRRALYSVIFNASPLSPDVPIELEDSLAWIRGHSPPLRALDDAAVVRRALDRLMLRADGTLAAPSTATRKRATLHSVLEYAVELELFTSNPLKRVRWKAPKATDIVDRRVVVNPAQARALLAAVWDADPALAAYFACLYFAGLRPAEARNLRATDCTLPESGWGLILLTGSHQRSGTDWTDSGSTDEERALKHRGRRARCPPIPNWSAGCGATSKPSRWEATDACSSLASDASVVQSPGRTSTQSPPGRSMPPGTGPESLP